VIPDDMLWRSTCAARTDLWWLGPTCADSHQTCAGSHRPAAGCSARADERQVLLGILDADPGLASDRAGQLLIGDENYFGGDFMATLAWGRPEAAAPSPQGRSRTSRLAFLQAATAGRRVHLRQLQGTARPRAARRQDISLSPDPLPAAHPRADRRQLAQRPDRPARETITPGPMTTNPWNRSSGLDRASATSSRVEWTPSFDLRFCR